ncbi:MAG TPA: DNA repair protein RecN [Acidimicrobiales bacterium]|nr:DNA repair protein RecN [Acidimicrobiales bacterium]
MLAELRIRDLGVIAGVDLLLRPGMTAVTGETGAGKTLLVQAIDLLLGGRAEAALVRAGTSQAEVEGRFVAGSATSDAGAAALTADAEAQVDEPGDVEVVLARVVPVAGRSRAYVDGRMAPASSLADTGRRLVDIHGQHAHQSLLAPAVQRHALDTFGGIDHTARAGALRRLAELELELSALGGDERSRARELDLLRYQIGELEAAGLYDPEEDDVLAVEEDQLAEAAAHREAAASAHHYLSADGGAADAVGLAIAAVAGRRPLDGLAGRLRSVAAEVAEAAADLRRAGEVLQDDPERLDQVRARRALLRELRRKYGDSLADVLAYADESRRRLEELESHNERVAVLEQRRDDVRSDLAAAEAAMGAARRATAARFSQAVAEHLHELAMAGARFEVSVGDAGAGDDVTFLLGANPGEACLPLSRVASGGELARTMLALRLVLGDGGDPGPGTVVFDEVDAGVGGEAALAVGRALAAVAGGPEKPGAQVLVVTHLPQVAAFADHQLVVRKSDVDGRTVVQVDHVEGEARVVELSRMLSGQPDSAAARDHAQELLAAATRGRQP